MHPRSIHHATLEVWTRIPERPDLWRPGLAVVDNETGMSRMTYSSQYCKAESVSLQRSIGDDRLINERWRETPEWIESVIAVSPMTSLEHCHIATLVELKITIREQMRCRARTYTRNRMSSRASSSSMRGKSWVLISNFPGRIKPSA